MALASDLMGLGVSPLIASRTANAGIGPVAATAGGTASITTAVKLGASQYLTIWTTSASQNGVILPTTGENGALIGDDYILHNNSSNSLNVFPSSGFTLNVVGSQFTVSAPFPVVQFHTLTIWYVNTSQMFGIYS